MIKSESGQRPFTSAAPQRTPFTKIHKFLSLCTLSGRKIPISSTPTTMSSVSISFFFNTSFLLYKKGTIVSSPLKRLELWPYGHTKCGSFAIRLLTPTCDLRHRKQRPWLSHFINFLHNRKWNKMCEIFFYYFSLHIRISENINGQLV